MVEFCNFQGANSIILIDFMAALWRKMIISCITCIYLYTGAIMAVYLHSAQSHCCTTCNCYLMIVSYINASTSIRGWQGVFYATVKYYVHYHIRNCPRFYPTTKPTEHTSCPAHNQSHLGAQQVCCCVNHPYYSTSTKVKGQDTV